MPESVFTQTIPFGLAGGVCCVAGLEVVAGFEDGAVASGVGGVADGGFTDAGAAAGVPGFAAGAGLAAVAAAGAAELAEGFGDFFAVEAESVAVFASVAGAALEDALAPLGEDTSELDFLDLEERFPEEDSAELFLSAAV